MRIFVMLCLVAFGHASSSGYNYGPSDIHSGSAISIVPGSGLPYDIPLNGYLAPAQTTPSHSSPSLPTPFHFSPSLSAPSLYAQSHSAPSYLSQYHQHSFISAPTEYDKEFYTFSAAEDEEDESKAAHIIAENAKQNLRVIFIKSPENRGLEEAALALAKQAAHQHTAIYVLNKQADINDLANKLNVAGKYVNNKPEVHFVKYRTPEDAANAQKVIQSHYDALGGNSQNFNGGVAPVINFASTAASREESVQPPQNTYLPSSVFRFPS